MFIARQPIFNKMLKVFGYELLFRESADSYEFGETDSTHATATVLSGLFEIGIETIVDDTKAFINFDNNCMLFDSIELIHPNNLIIEVLEDIKIDENLLNRLTLLKNKGYKIALDDFVEDYHTYPLVPLADIIKYDLIATPLEDIKKQVKLALEQNKILLAEKVETEEQFVKAKSMGFSLFQGYFFSKPKIIKNTNHKKTLKTQYTMILNELQKEEPSYQTLVELFSADPNLVYRLIGISGRRNNKDFIYSVKNALVYMGFKEIERWIHILMLRDLSTNKPEELVKLSLVRSKFGELIAEYSLYRKKKMEISIIGLLSNIDALIDQSMEEALSQIVLPEDIKEALIYRKGIYKPICELVDSYEKGIWGNVETICEEIEMDCGQLYQLYVDSLRWADGILSKI